MIYTSNFFNAWSHPGRMAISNGKPKGWEGPHYEALYPTWQMIKMPNFTAEKFTQQYTDQILKRLDPHKVAKELDGKVLLCWEAPYNFCHRQIVANWLKDAGYEVEELPTRPRKKKPLKVAKINPQASLFEGGL